MVDILYDARWVGNHGIGRFAGELQKLLPDLIPFAARRAPFHPLDPFLLGADLRRIKPRLFFSPGYNPQVGWPGAFVFTLHDLNHLCVPENSNALKRAYYQHIIKPACHRARRVLTVSEYSKRQIAAWAGISEDHLLNVGNGVGPAFVPTGEKYSPGFPYLLYVGSRKAHKNLVRLLRAYSRSGVQKDVRLLLSGAPDPQFLRTMEQLGLTGRVSFRELSSDEELSAVYRGALAFLFPSLYEGFGLPPVEAMACGVPVLTSNVCSLPEVTGDAAMLVDPMEVDQIAEGIKTLVENSNLRASLRDKGLARASMYSWQETARLTWQAVQLALDSDSISELAPKRAALPVEKREHQSLPAAQKGMKQV